MTFELRRIPMCNLEKDAKKLGFDSFDKDEIGVLDLEELTKAGKKLKFGTLTNDNVDDIPKCFDQVDVDKSGFIEFKQQF